MWRSGQSSVWKNSFALTDQKNFDLISYRTQKTPGLLSQIN